VIASEWFPNIYPPLKKNNKKGKENNCDNNENDTNAVKDVQSGSRVTWSGAELL